MPSPSVRRPGRTTPDATAHTDRLGGAGNFGWTLACITLPLSDTFALSSLGVAWVPTQAPCVLALAELR